MRLEDDPVPGTEAQPVTLEAFAEATRGHPPAFPPGGLCEDEASGCGHDAPWRGARRGDGMKRLAEGFAPAVGREGIERWQALACGRLRMMRHGGFPG
jgi:hypothetical protein